MDFKRYFYTNYFVSEKGEVKSIIKGSERFLNPYNKNGFLVVEIDGKDVFVHRMVKICFDFRIDHIFKRIKHIDGDKRNNNLKNLKWI